MNYQFESFLREFIIFLSLNHCQFVIIILILYLITSLQFLR